MPEPEMNVSRGQWVYYFGQSSSQGDPARKDVLGGKGASLAAMSRAGLPVPPGFTISTEACRHFLEHGHSWPPGLEAEVQSGMKWLEEVLGLGFGAGNTPLLVSVRSGAAASMPGMMDTILNCGLHSGLAPVLPDPRQFWLVYNQFVRQFARTVGGLSEEDLSRVTVRATSDEAVEHSAIEVIALYESRTGKRFPNTAWDALRACIDAVFLSWNSDRAKVYRKAHNIHGLVGTAVNVQAMFPSEISGIAFTANPTNPAANELIIESAYGLGESVVSGDVTPDRFVLDYGSLAIKNRTIGHKGQVVLGLASGKTRKTAAPDAPSLSDTQVREVAETALKVERYFGHPVDIEWGIFDDRIALLQSRPIRGMDVARDVEVGRREEIDRLRALTAGRRRAWVVHNLSETLPAPTPLTWDIIRHFMSGDGGFGRMYRDFGYRPAVEVRQQGFLELICGRIYVDPDRAAKLFWDAIPLVYDHNEILRDPSIIESAPGTFDAEKADVRFLLKAPATIFSMFRANHRMRRMRRMARALFEEEALPRYLQYVKDARAAELTALPTASVVAAVRDRADRVLGDFGKESLKPGFFGGVARAELEALVVQLLGRAQGLDLCRELISGLLGDSTVEQNILLWKVAQGEATLDIFLERFGHRAALEMELAQPRWREDPSFLEKSIARCRSTGASNPEQLHQSNIDRRLKAEERLPALLAEWGGRFIEDDIFVLMREAQTLLPYREVGKHYLMMGYETIRLAINELGRRWNLGRDVYFLRYDELDRFENERDGLTKAIAQRKVRWQSAQRLELPAIVDLQQIGQLGLPRQVEASSEYQAICLAPGVSEGTVCIVRSPDEAQDLGDRCILVCSSTDPGWTVLFTTIKGLVVERGGVLSHGAITARDFGVPAVACPDATKVLRTGMRVRVDADKGVVSVLEE